MGLMAFPWTTTWEPVFECGFNKTGFMWMEGSTPAHSACMACARAISPPSAVTHELLDIFCALNGDTRQPFFLKIRHSAATSMDLPTPEPVPCTIKVLACRMAGFKYPPQRLGEKLIFLAPGHGHSEKLIVEPHKIGRVPDHDFFRRQFFRQFAGPHAVFQLYQKKIGCRRKKLQLLDGRQLPGEKIFFLIEQLP